MQKTKRTIDLTFDSVEDRFRKKEKQNKAVDNTKLWTFLQDFIKRKRKQKKGGLFKAVKLKSKLKKSQRVLTLLKSMLAFS